MHSGTFCIYVFWNILHAFWNVLKHSACILEHSACILEQFGGGRKNLQSYMYVYLLWIG